MDEYQIVELVKDGYRTGSIKPYHNFLLNDLTIISDVLYERSYRHNPSINKQVIGYVYNYTTSFVSNLEFPTLDKWYIISSPYLQKKGHLIRGDSSLGPAPLPNLKYIIYSIKSDTQSEFQDRLVIELVDVDVAADNLNLPKIMSSVLGPKSLSENNFIEDDELNEINNRMLSQKLFAGHTWNDAKRIVFRYFNSDKRELWKKVLKISQAYERVLRPYRVVYNTKTWEPVVF